MMIVVGKKEAAGERCGGLCCGVNDGGVMTAVMAEAMVLVMLDLSEQDGGR